MKPSRTGCTRAAAFARLTRTSGSGDCGGSFPPARGFNCPGSGKGFGSSTILTGAGGSTVSFAGTALS